MTSAADGRLVESGAISHPELSEPVARIGELKAQLAAAASEPDDAPAASEPDDAPPAEPEG